MKISSLVLAFAGCAAAEERVVRQSAPTFGMAATINGLQAQVSVIRSQVDDGTVNGFLSGLSSDTISATNSMTTENVLLRQRVSTLEARVSNQAATLTDNLQYQTTMMNSALNSQTAAMAGMQTSFEDTLSEAQSDISTALAAGASTTGAAVSTLTRTTVSRMTAMGATTSTSIATLNSSMVSRVGLKAPMKHHYWKGGCASTQYGGWDWVCHNRVTVNAAAPYFRTNGANRWIAILAGNFRVTVFTINHSCSWAHMRLVHQGTDLYTTHGHPSFSWWQDNYINSEVRATASQWWAVQTYASCGHAAWYGGATHGVLESHYEGLH